jgi:tol-pal system protein YbgF
MGFKQACLLAALLLFAGGCATKDDLAYLQRDFDDMKTKYFSLEKNLGSVRNETREVTEKGVQTMQKDLDTLRRTAADLQATLDATRVDMQSLTGRFDDLAAAGKKPLDELGFLKEESNRRLMAMEERTAKLEKALAELRKAVSDAASKAEAAAATPEALYNQGRELFKGGDLAKARELFSRFLEKYPKHELAANARYWLGETYYSEKKFEEAILEYQQVIKDFPGKEKVPAAMLKQALAFRELGDVKSARYILKKLTEDFPLSEEAPIAKEKLKTLK